MEQASIANLESMPSVSAVDAVDMNSFLASVERQALGTARIRLRHPEDAMDAVQDAMMRLVSHYADKPADEWKPLFWSILRRRIVDIQRRRKVRSIVISMRTGLDDDDGLPPDREPVEHGSGPLQTLDNQQAMQRLNKALQGLPRRQFEAFSLRILNELDVADTARAMGCSEGSVKTHLSRARTALAAQLEDWQ